MGERGGTHLRKKLLQNIKKKMRGKISVIFAHLHRAFFRLQEDSFTVGSS